MKKPNVIDVKKLEIKIDPAPDIIVEFTTNSGMSTDIEMIPRLTLRYHGLILDLAGCQVLKQGCYSSGNFPSGLAWRIRVYRINIDNKFAIKFINAMSAALNNEIENI